MIMALTTVTATQLFDQVKVNAVELWHNPALGGSSQVAVQFAGATVGSSGDGKVWSDNSMGIEPAHVRASPNKMSQAAQWQSFSGNTAFLLTGPVGTIIDVDLTLRTVATSAPVATPAVVAATAGEVYYRGLDSVAIATSNLVPQAFPTR